jgi:hypothetical protein
MHVCNPSSLRLRQEDIELEASLGYLKRPCLKKQTNIPPQILPPQDTPIKERRGVFF